jgi:hypothetical protein
VYNAVPPALMLQYAAFKEHGLAEVCRVASAVTFIAGAGEPCSHEPLACMCPERGGAQGTVHASC